MKILFLTPDLPYPPQQGGTIRSYQFMSHLASMHEIYLISFAEKETDPDSVDHLQRLCRNVAVIPAPHRSNWERLRSLFLSNQPDMASRRYSTQFKAHLDTLLAEERFEIVQIESLEMSPYISTIQTRKNSTGPRIIFDDLNIEYRLQRRAWETDRDVPGRWGEAFYSLIQWQRLIFYERRALQHADGALAVSQEDAEGLRQLVPQARVAVIPNGVDTSFYRHTEDPGGEKLVFVGKMDFRPNVDGVLWFTENVWPRIKREKPHAQFWVVGKNPSPRVRSLAREREIIVTGPVPDVRPYLANAAVVAIPLRMGSGTRLKVLEAMAMGKAIVSTTLGCEGIALQPGQEVLIADEPEEFAKYTLQLLEDREARVRMGARMRLLAEEKHDWKIIVPQLEDFYIQINPPVARS
ncbi:MAG: glycosyltransferase [Chloroflexi bacterium]|nr:glycosyltransferase [Chloroflexota bacterium]